MSEWMPIETAPKDHAILVYGKAQDTQNPLVRFTKAGVYSAYWDEIDDSFCLSGASWVGPFIKPTHWMPLPEPPE